MEKVIKIIVSIITSLISGLLINYLVVGYFNFAEKLKCAPRTVFSNKSVVIWDGSICFNDQIVAFLMYIFIIAVFYICWFAAYYELNKYSPNKETKKIYIDNKLA